MKFIKVMLLWAIPYFCTKKGIRVPHWVPNPCGIFCKLAILRFLSPFHTFPHTLLRWSKPLGLGGDRSIQLSYWGVLSILFHRCMYPYTAIFINISLHQSPIDLLGQFLIILCPLCLSKDCTDLDHSLCCQGIIAGTNDIQRYKRSQNKLLFLYAKIRRLFTGGFLSN